MENDILTKQCKRSQMCILGDPTIRLSAHHPEQQTTTVAIHINNMKVRYVFILYFQYPRILTRK